MSGAIAVTGLGLCTPLGGGVETNWQALTAVAPLGIPRGDEAHGSGSRRDRALAMASEACEEALRQAQIWDGQALGGVDAERVGCTLSVSKPFIESEDALPLPPDTLLGSIREKFGFQGEARNLVAACATGAYAIALAASWLEQDLCDLVVAGSVEAPLHPLLAAGFSQMGVLSPDGMTRPFDRDRSGFRPGAGAGVLVLERQATAGARRAHVLAQLRGWGLGADGHSAVAFNSDGLRIADVIGRALARGGLSTRDVRHVNAHGTGTRLNDWIETQALQKAFGRHASALMISGTKASTGHLLGAAGSVEAVLSILALQKQFVPATVTLETPDPECALDYTARQGHAAHFAHALSLSFGFGGPIGALLFSVGAL